MHCGLSSFCRFKVAFANDGVGKTMSSDMATGESSFSTPGWVNTGGTTEGRIAGGSSVVSDAMWPGRARPKRERLARGFFAAHALLKQPPVILLPR